jgi:hypothetical protein
MQSILNSTSRNHVMALPSCSGIQMTSRRYEHGCFAQSERRHVVTDAFEIHGMNAVCFVPDAHMAAHRYRTIECRPCRSVLAIRILCIALQMFERAPIPQENRGVSEPRFSAQLAARRILLQFAEHSRHRPCNRKPFVKFPRTVYSHSDQEHNKITFDLRCHSVRDYLRHLCLPLISAGSLYWHLSP